MRNILIALFYSAAICGAGIYAAGALGRTMETMTQFLGW
jgi:hypothetical protein